MILPSKHLSQERALLTVGARILQRLHDPMTVSAVWEELTRPEDDQHRLPPKMRYDEYVLALDLLFFIGSIEIKDGLLARINP